jgi:hypothetical protein
VRGRFSRGCVHWLIAGAVAACGGALPTPALAGDATFRALPPVSVGTNPQAVAIADLNGDGIQDLAVANSGDDSVSALVGSGSGTFAPIPTRSVGGAPHAVVAGDFNGDGIQDLATADFNAKTVTLLAGTGSGFPLAGALSAGVNPQSLAIGYFNGDGIQDLAAANSSARTVSVFLGTGTGLFDPAPALPTGAYPESLVVGDFNGDGNQDLATANSSDNTVSVLIGSGAGTFAAAVSTPVGLSPRALAVGDFNGDGDQDLATANSGANSVSVLIGSGLGTFTAASTPVTGAYPTSLAVGDFDGDGIQDLVTANRDAASVSVLVGNGSGAFTAAAAPSVGTGPESVVVGDLNGDGVEDLVTANRGAKTASVLLGNGTPADAGNLLANRGAEGAGAAATPTATPEFPGWSRTVGSPTFVRYSTPGFPSFIDAARWGGGSGLFTGGVGPSAAAQQTVSVADRAASIDAGLAGARLSALLGGHLTTADAASVEAEFLTGAGQPVGSALGIGPLTPTDRRNQTVLLRRAAAGPLPAGTRAIRVTMRMTRASGDYDDGYVDEVTLVVSSVASGVGAAGPLTLTRFRITNRRFHVARRHRPAGGPRTPAGTAFRYSLSARARVRIAITRLLPGRRRADGRCVSLARLRPTKPCRRRIGVGALSVVAAGGDRRIRFSGRLKGRRLPPGRYRASITATAAGVVTPARRLTFTIAR